MTTDIKEKQAVVDETKDVAPPTPEVDGARKDEDLDTLLAQYDEGTKPLSPPEPKAEPKVEQAEPVWAQNLRQRYFNEEIDRAGEEIFDGLEATHRNKRAWLDQIAREKPAVAKAFLNKDSDPASWKKLIPGLKLEARKDFPSAVKVDPDATADRNAVAAAVRGASTRVTAEPPPNLGEMSEAEFREYTRKNFKF